MKPLTKKRAAASKRIQNLCLDPNVVKGGKRLAAKDGRSLSAWVNQLIIREIQTAKP